MYQQPVSIPAAYLNPLTSKEPVTRLWVYKATTVNLLWRLAVFRFGGFARTKWLLMASVLNEVRSSDASSSMAKPGGSSSDASNRLLPAFYTSDKLLRLRQQKTYRMKKDFVATVVDCPFRELGTHKRG